MRALGWLTTCLVVLVAGPAVAQPAAIVEAAVHRGHLAGNELRWTSTVRVGLAGLLTHEELRLDVAAPDGVRVDVVALAPGVGDVRGSDGRLIALTLDSAALVQDPVFVVTLVQRAPAVGEARLEAPVFAGLPPQLVLVEGAEGVTFLPDEDLGVVQRLGFSAPPDLRAPERRRLLARVGARAPRPSGAAIWIRGERVAAARGLRGELTVTAQRRARAGGWLGLGALVGVALLWVVLRGLDPVARVEEADQVLRAERVPGV